MGGCKLILAKATIAEGRPLRGLRPLKCRANITEESYFVPPEAQCHIFEDFCCLHKVAYFWPAQFEEGRHYAKGKILSINIRI